MFRELLKVVQTWRLLHAGKYCGHWRKFEKQREGGEGAKNMEFPFPIDPTGNLKESTQEEYVLHNEASSLPSTYHVKCDLVVSTNFI